MLIAYCFSFLPFGSWSLGSCSWLTTTTITSFGKYCGYCVWFEPLLCRDPNRIAITHSLCYETDGLKMLRTKEGGCCLPFPAGLLQFYSTGLFDTEAIVMRKFVQAVPLSAFSTTPSGNTASWHNSNLVIREI